MTKGSSIDRKETMKEEALKHRREERTYKAKQQVAAIEDSSHLSVLNGI